MKSVFLLLSTLIIGLGCYSQSRVFKQDSFEKQADSIIYHFIRFLELDSTGRYAFEEVYLSKHSNGHLAEYGNFELKGDSLILSTVSRRPTKRFFLFQSNSLINISNPLQIYRTASVTDFIEFQKEYKVPPPEVIEVISN